MRYRRLRTSLATFALSGLRGAFIPCAPNQHPFTGANLIGTTNSVYGFVTDNTALMVAGKYTWNPFKFFGGYEYIHMANPAGSPPASIRSPKSGIWHYTELGEAAKRAMWSVMVVEVLEARIDVGDVSGQVVDGIVLYAWLRRIGTGGNDAPDRCVLKNGIQRGGFVAGQKIDMRNVRDKCRTNLLLPTRLVASLFSDKRS